LEAAIWGPAVYLRLTCIFDSTGNAVTDADTDQHIVLAINEAAVDRSRHGIRVPCAGSPAPRLVLRMVEHLKTRRESQTRYIFTVLAAEV